MENSLKLVRHSSRKSLILKPGIHFEILSRSDVTSFDVREMSKQNILSGYMVLQGQLSWWAEDIEEANWRIVLYLA